MNGMTKRSAVTKSVAVFIGTLALVVTQLSYAQSQSEQLQRLVEQLQKSPGDNALREQVIKLGAMLQPVPTIPDEARRRMNRGTTAFKDAKSSEDFRDAVVEFRAAVAAAPWWGDAYNNLGVALDNQGDHDAAVRELRWALVATPGSTDVRALLDQAEYRAEKENREKETVAKSQQETQERFFKSLDGGIWRQTPGERDFDFFFEVRGREIEFYNVLKPGTELARLNPDLVNERQSYGKTTFDRREFLLSTDLVRTMRGGSAEVRLTISEDARTITEEVSGEFPTRLIYRRIK